MAANDHLIVAAIVVAAGSGARLGTGTPKAFVAVAGRTLLEHAVAGVRAHPRVGRCVVVAPVELVEHARALVGTDVGTEIGSGVGTDVVAGGATRQESVDSGLRSLGDEPDLVLVHDAARPFAPVAVIERVLAALDAGAAAAIPALPVTDTIKQVDAAGHVLATVDRGALVAVQTPQGFRRALLVAAHAAADHYDATDDAALIEASGGLVLVVPGDPRSFKITVPLDLAMAEVVARG